LNDILRVILAVKVRMILVINKFFLLGDAMVRKHEKKLLGRRLLAVCSLVIVR